MDSDMHKRNIDELETKGERLHGHDEYLGRSVGGLICQIENNANMVEGRLNSVIQGCTHKFNEIVQIPEKARRRFEETDAKLQAVFDPLKNRGPALELIHLLSNLDFWSFPSLCVTPRSSAKLCVP